MNLNGFFFSFRSKTRYDQQSQQPGPQQAMQYGAQGWTPTGAPQQRPATYNPQMGQQAYRPPPPPNVSVSLRFFVLPLSMPLFICN